MKKERSIVLNCNFFIQIRNNLRDIWLVTANKQSKVLFDQRKKIFNASDRYLYREEYNEALTLLLEELRTIDKIRITSICVCGWCHQKHKNMRYKKITDSLGQWFCLDCFKEHESYITNITSPLY